MIRLDGYILKKKIHSGKSIVYRGNRTTDSLPVIIKVPGNNHPFAESAKRLHLEFSLLSRLNHKGIIKVCSMANYSDGSALIMEDSGAVSMKQRLNESTFSVSSFLKNAIQLIKILEYIHENKIIHKNLNPSNILIHSATGDLKIIDFGYSSLITHEQAFSSNPNELEGTLAYISPEQTGRINSFIDTRSDYYSLGITFFEMLTGELPFKGDDALELIHCQIAREIPVQQDAYDCIPPVLWAIIKKMTEKDKNRRYQSASGIHHDLEKCLALYKANGEISKFTIGSHDVSSRFEIPQKLYGRDHEIREIVNGFIAVSEGLDAHCLISGNPGIGKTALVDEIKKHISEKRAYYLSGKYEQLQQGQVLSGVIQGFRGLMNQILGEKSERLNRWKKNLSAALGGNGQLLISIIPELEDIIGSQPPVEELTGTDSISRFMFTFRNFMQVFAKIDHPLVISLDDLQWADMATLQLLESLVSFKRTPYVYFIGTYRENEVNEAHPLFMTISEFKKRRNLNHIQLKPLGKESLRQIVADTLLYRNPEDVDALSDILFNKTGGNPFFLKEMLKSLYAKKMIRFDGVSKHFSYDLEKMAEVDVCTNVVDYLIDKYEALPEVCKKLLTIASCLGNRFSFNALTELSGYAVSQIRDALKISVEEEIIKPVDSQYRIVFEQQDENISDNNPYFQFLHDKIQQAAYSMGNEETKKAVHLKYGRFLADEMKPSAQGYLLIDILHHLNSAGDLISSKDEKLLLSRMNLEAAIKARKATAYLEAVKYLQIGMKLIPGDPWKNHYELIYEFSLEYSRSSYLSGSYEEAETSIHGLLQHVKEDLEKAEAAAILVEQYSTLGKMEESIQVGLEALGFLGIRIPDIPSKILILTELIKIRINRKGRTIADLENAPKIDDPQLLKIFSLIMAVIPSAYLMGRENLYVYMILRIVNLSLKNGVCSDSAYGYATYGILLCSAFGNPEDGSEFGKLAMSIIEKYPGYRVQHRVIHAYVDFIFHWANHPSGMDKILRSGIKMAYQTGDLLHLSYISHHLNTWNPKLMIDELISEKLKDRAIIQETGYCDALNETDLVIHLYMNYQNKTEDKFSFNTDNFDEAACIAEMKKNNFITGLTAYHIWKAEMYTLYGEYGEAARHIEEATPYLSSVLGLPYMIKFCISNFLLNSAIYSKLGHNKKKKALKKMKREYGKIKGWAAFCPENFNHLKMMMEGELLKHSTPLHVKKKHTPVTLYNKAIESAQKNFWLKDEAVINELAARFYLEADDEKAATGYLYDAYDIYNRWGAIRKTEILYENYSSIFDKRIPEYQIRTTEQQYGDVKKITSSSDVAGRSGITNISGALDFESLLKSARTISEEIVLEPLMKKMMQIVIENAGAQSGFFIVLKKEKAVILSKASFPDGNVEVNLAIPVENSGEIPVRLINYAIRTGKIIVPIDMDGSVSSYDEEYFHKNRIKSALCLPLIRQDKLQGILYLENNLISGAFSPDRIEVLNMLTSQIIISLENAQLFRSLQENNANLEQQVAERTKALKKLAMTDPLTKLMNRRAMMDKMEEESKRYRRNKKTFSIILCDIDNFKKFNDTYGHDCGDAVLQNVARVMTETIREQDFLCRWGGEEFLFMLPETESHGAVELAEKLRTNIWKNNFVYNDLELTITMTFGVSTFSLYPSIEGCIKHADESLYEGKKQGKNRVIAKI